MVMAGEQAATGRRCLTNSATGNCFPGGTRTRKSVEVSVAYTTGQGGCYGAPIEGYAGDVFWPGNKRLRNVRRLKPLDDLSLRSRQDSNLRLPLDRRSIRYLHHRPRWVLQDAIPPKTAPGNGRREFGASSSRNLVLRDYAPAPQSDLLRQGFRPCWSMWRK